MIITRAWIIRRRSTHISLLMQPGNAYRQPICHVDQLLFDWHEAATRAAVLSEFDLDGFVVVPCDVMVATGT